MKNVLKRHYDKLTPEERFRLDVPATARGDRLHETERGGRHFDGEEPGPAHPLTVALPTADNLKNLAREEGTVLGLFVGEDAIIRGVRERPRSPVERSEDGTVGS